MKEVKYKIYKSKTTEYKPYKDSYVPFKNMNKNIKFIKDTEFNYQEMVVMRSLLNIKIKEIQKDNIREYIEV
jgi:hypothetical protein